MAEAENVNIDVQEMMSELSKINAQLSIDLAAERAAKNTLLRERTQLRETVDALARRCGEEVKHGEEDEGDRDQEG